VRIDGDFIPFDRVTCRYVYIYKNVDAYNNRRFPTNNPFTAGFHTYSRIIYIYLFIIRVRVSVYIREFTLFPFHANHGERGEYVIINNKWRWPCTPCMVYYIIIYNIIVYTYICRIQFIFVVAVNTKYNIRPKEWCNTYILCIFYYVLVDDIYIYIFFFQV